MAGPITVDTPDYQRGTVNAQVQLAAPGARVPSVTVGVPPNAESLIVTNLVWSVHATVQVRGVTTGALYPGVLLQPGPAGINTATWVFDIAAALDTEVTISVAPTPLFAWFVYADGGVHLTSDASALRSGLGQGYVIPSAPSTVSGDHPPSELQTNSFGASVAGQVFAAPGVGQRYRIFSVEMAAAGTASGAVFARIYDNADGRLIGMFGAGGASDWGGRSFTQYPLTGLVLPGGGPIELGYDVGSGTFIRGIITYTLETI